MTNFQKPLKVTSQSDVVKPFESAILLRAKNHNKQKILTDLPAFSFVKLNKFWFKTFSQTKLFLIMEVLIFPAYSRKKRELFLVFQKCQRPEVEEAIAHGRSLKYSLGLVDVGLLRV